MAHVGKGSWVSTLLGQLGMRDCGGKERPNRAVPDANLPKSGSFLLSLDMRLAAC